MSQLKKIKTNDGVKQGGILSGYLFNFYMNSLLEECIDLAVLIERTKLQ